MTGVQNENFWGTSGPPVPQQLEKQNRPGLRAAAVSSATKIQMIEIIV